MKAEDKAKIMETLGMLTKSITKLQEEIKGISSSNNPLRTTKSKAQVVLFSQLEPDTWCSDDVFYSCTFLFSQLLLSFLLLWDDRRCKFDHLMVPSQIQQHYVKAFDSLLSTCYNLFHDVSSFSVQAQKELLDAELDLYKKTQAGEDTAMLKIKYTQLQIEVMTKRENVS